MDEYMRKLQRLVALGDLAARQALKVAEERAYVPCQECGACPTCLGCDCGAEPFNRWCRCLRPRAPLTVRQLRGLPYGVMIFHGTMRQGSAGRAYPFRVRVTGVCKTWKRDPERWRLPVKHGLRDSAYLGSPGEQTADVENVWYLAEHDAMKHGSS
jgi:hypothetical protein